MVLEATVKDLTPENPGILEVAVNAAKSFPWWADV